MRPEKSPLDVALRESSRLVRAISVHGVPGGHRKLLLRSMWKVKKTTGIDHSLELLDGEERRESWWQLGRSEGGRSLCCFLVCLFSVFFKYRNY